MVLKWTRTKPEPLKYFEQELNLHPNRYLKRFDNPAKNYLLGRIGREMDLWSQDCGLKPRHKSMLTAFYYFVYCENVSRILANLRFKKPLCAGTAVTSFSNLAQKYKPTA